MSLINLLGASLVAIGVFTVLTAFVVVGVITGFGADRGDSAGPFLFSGLGVLLIGVGAYLMRRPRKGDPFDRQPS